MVRRITATKAARELSDILDKVEHRSTEFVIERHGKEIARLLPSRVAPTGITGRELAELLPSLPAPDAAFVADLRWIRRHQGRLPKDPWARSSTRRS